MTDTKKIITVWQTYLKTAPPWTALIDGYTSKATGCGLIYELPNPIVRPQESFAIADMRNIPYAQPHYHRETEIYFVLEGDGIVVVGDQVTHNKKDSVIVIPSNIAHFTIPHDNLVLAVVNTPPQQDENYIPLHNTNPRVKFDKKHFEALLRNSQR
jgi:mannose-6-phosphate isomerase-like protein (cupin superfamily)